MQEFIVNDMFYDFPVGAKVYKYIANQEKFSFIVNTVPSHYNVVKSEFDFIAGQLTNMFTAEPNITI